MSQPLWIPGQERIRDSELSRFSAFCQRAHGYQGPGSDQKLYHDLHNWSVSKPGDFWRAVWDFFEVAGESGLSALISSKSIKENQWFPAARLNFAENLLRHDGEACALIERREDGGRRSISFAELRAEVAALSGFLKQAGVGQGDRVAAFLPNASFSIVGMLATASLGAVWSSCSPDFGFQGVLDRFSQIQPKVLIACDGYQYAQKRIDTRDRVAEIKSAITSLNAVVIAPYQDSEKSLTYCDQNSDCTHWDHIMEQFQKQPLEFCPMAFDDPLYILYSSGTTGKPKCIIHSVGGTLLQHLKELGLHTDVKRGTRLFYYTTCGWMMWNWLASGLALGATVILYDGSPFHPQQTILWDIAEQEAIEVFGASAKYYAACEKYGLKPGTRHPMPQLKTLLSTGSPLSHESFEYLYREVKQDVCVSSISGGTDIVSCFALGAPVLPVYKGELQCIGLGMDVDFLDEEGLSLCRGKGELVCKQAFPSMPVGFWNDSSGELFHSAYFDRFDNVWAHGDYGEFIPHTDNTLPRQLGVIIHGRSDAVLNPGGVRIGTAEIYRQVEKIDAVFESIAIAQNWLDDVRIVLFVRLKDGFTLDDNLVVQIKTTIRANTSPRHVPAKIIEVSDIPRTLSGKLVELAVRKVVHGEAVANKDALANPEALDLFKNLVELDS